MEGPRCSPSSGFAIQEFLTKVPVVEETPQFFVPPEGVEQAFFPHVGENFFLRKDVEAEFYVFELVGEIVRRASCPRCPTSRVDRRIPNTRCNFIVRLRLRPRPGPQVVQAPAGRVLRGRHRFGRGGE